MVWVDDQEERKRILMDLHVMTTHDSPYIVQYYGSVLWQVRISTLYHPSNAGPCGTSIPSPLYLVGHMSRPTVHCGTYVPSLCTLWDIHPIPLHFVGHLSHPTVPCGTVIHSLFPRKTYSHSTALLLRFCTL